MTNHTQPSCPACGRTMVHALRWARATDPAGALALGLDPSGTTRMVLDDPTIDIQCGGCGTTIRIRRDEALAAA